MHILTLKQVIFILVYTCAAMGRAFKLQILRSPPRLRLLTYLTLSLLDQGLLETVQRAVENKFRIGNTYRSVKLYHDGNKWKSLSLKSQSNLHKQN